jgi:hypothetical protein
VDSDFEGFIGLISNQDSFPITSDAGFLIK